MANMRPVSADLELPVQKNSREKSERFLNDINVIRSWIDKQPHLVGRNDDQFIITFLRCCGYSLEETKKRIDAYLTCKTIYPDLFKKRHVTEDMLEIFRSGLFVIPPIPKQGPRLFIMQLGYYDPTKHAIPMIFKLQFMLYEFLAFKDDYSSIHGIETIYDLKNCTLSQVMRFDPVVLKKTYIYIEQCMPLKLVRAHIINLNKEFHGIFKFAKSVLPSNIPFEIVLHEKEEDMFEYFSRDQITIEYEGQNGTKPELLKQWELILQDYAEFFAKDSTYGTNEKLRQGRRNDLQADFGIEGSFRQLDID